MNQLIKFWKQLDINQRKLVHPEDIIEEDKYHADINQYDDYINTSDFGLDETKFHLNLIPIPYIGDIQKAKIYIVMLNPGFGILDYYAEFAKDKELRTALINNLWQEKFDVNYPFIFLNPKYLWHGGGQYYEGKFKKLIKKVKYDNNGYSYAQSLSHIAKRVAVLQLVPYHSKKSPKNYAYLRSPEIMKVFIDKLKLEAEKGEKCIICARGKQYLNLEEDVNPNIIIFSGNQPRAAHFSENNLKTEKWKKICEFLK